MPAVGGRSPERLQAAIRAVGIHQHMSPTPRHARCPAHSHEAQLLEAVEQVVAAGGGDGGAHGCRPLAVQLHLTIVDQVPVRAWRSGECEGVRVSYMSKNILHICIYHGASGSSRD